MTSTLSSTRGEDYPGVLRFLKEYREGPGLVQGSSPAHRLAETVDRAVVSDDPFTTATIDDFLPAELYTAVLAAWETVDIQPVRLPGSGYVGSRAGARLTHLRAGESSPSLGSPWQEVSDAVRSATLADALFRRFAPIVESHLHSPAIVDASTPAFVLWANQDHGSDEALGAHLDGARKLLTVVLYLDLDGPRTADSERLWGTTLYRSAPGAVEPVAFSSNESHEPAGHVLFAPNRAFVMANNDYALHGVAGGEQNVTRRSLMWGYWYF